MKNEKNQYSSLSRVISHALRHEPNKYGLELDSDGWVDLNSLVNGLKGESSKFKTIKINDIIYSIENSPKKRHEIADGKIRALYGHSSDHSVSKVAAEVDHVPDVLFHGTPEGNLPSIQKQGLLAKARQFVHLTTDENQALLVGKRYSDSVILLEVLARKSAMDGSIFFQEENIWLTDNVQPKFIVFPITSG